MLMEGTHREALRAYALTLGKLNILDNVKGFETIFGMLKNLSKCPTGQCNDDSYKAKECYCHDLRFTVGKSDDNFYRNVHIPPNDGNRVIIPSSRRNPNGFVSASFISFDSPREFIACCYPKNGQRKYHWQMIYQEKCPVIVAIGDPSAGPMNTYYPLRVGSVSSHGAYRIKCSELVSNDSYEHRVLTITENTCFWKRPGPAHELHHFVYKKWPDMGIPEDIRDYVLFFEMVKRHGFGEKVKMMDLDFEGPSYASVVHCTGGVGRTGCVLIIDHLMRGIEKGYPRTFCIEDTILKLRRQRMECVQTAKQYRAIYNIFLVNLLHNFSKLAFNRAGVALEAEKWVKKSKGFPIRFFINPKLWTKWENRDFALTWAIEMGEAMKFNQGDSAAPNQQH